MKIGVDAGALGITDERLKVGVYRVIRNLLRELSVIDTKNQYILYSFDPIDRDVMSEFGINMDNKVLWPVKGWFRFRLPVELRLRPVDLFLGTAQALPSTSEKNIGFIYDLGFLYNPHAYGRAFTKLRRQTQYLVTHADSIVTISHASKNDIIKEFHTDDAKITVSYPGADERFNPKGGAFYTKTPYVLFVGSLNKAKDLSLAIRSFALFLKKIQTPFKFYLIGGDYWPDPAIDKTILACGLQNHVKKIGIIPDDELPEYYRGARAFFTTPLHEGFCLPVAESMTCGTPVVSVDRGAMREIVGSGGVIAKTIRPQDIADALYSVVSDSNLRKRYQKNALKQAKKYKWKSFAKNVYECIKRYEH